MSATSRDTRAEQCLAWGRSTEWMLAHGYTRDDINRAVQRMNAAHRNDNAAYIRATRDEQETHA